MWKFVSYKRWNSILLRAIDFEFAIVHFAENSERSVQIAFGSDINFIWNLIFDFFFNFVLECPVIEILLTCTSM